MRKFKTESKKLLDLMINSIYTNKEIFLRELISNASDAIDKLYFKSLTDTSIQIAKDNLRIAISADETERTITVSDNGIGMTKEDLERNLSTIAHSDSLEFKLENAAEQGDAIDIIGQFGVGFYSAFMVAKKIEVLTKRYDSEEAWLWVSEGVEGFDILPAEKESCGTDVIVTLKDDSPDDNYSAFANEDTIRELVKKYSNYVRYPIQFETKLQQALPKPADAPADYKTQYEDIVEVETLNSMVPIWKRGKGEVSDEEYAEFYKSEFHDSSAPARTFTVRAEGTLSYDALLFIPAHRSMNFYTNDFKKGLALYSSGVMIMDKCPDLLPDCFNFVFGVVDSQDLSLNISREILQHNKQLRAIARKIERKIKQELLDYQEDDREGYEAFFSAFGQVMKYGLYTSNGQNNELLKDLLMFYSVRDGKLVTLKEYVDAMHPDQERIFYAAGDSVDMLEKAPIVKSVAKKGYDVLLCVEDVDEFCLSALAQYDNKTFQNVANANLDLDTEEEKKEAKDVAEQNSELLDAMKEALGDKVARVAVSTRLIDEPVCLVAEGPISLEMERVIGQLPNNLPVTAQHVLEVNPKHAIFKALQDAQESGDSEKVSAFATILYDQARLIEGLPIEDPAEYSSLVCKFLA